MIKKYLSARVLCTLMVIILINSCSDNKDIQNIKLNNDEILFSNFHENKSIKFKNVFNYPKSPPTSLHVLDSTIIIFSSFNKTDSYFYNYSLHNNQLSNGYVKRGRGPNEALGGFFSGTYGNTLWLFDITLKKIITLNKNKALINPQTVNFNEYSINDNYYMISFIDSLKYVSVGNIKSSTKASEIDLIQSKKIHDYGEFYNIPESLPLDAVKDAYTPFVFSKPNGEKIVLAYRHTDVIEIYNLLDNKKTAIKGIEQFDVDFVVRNRKNHHFMGRTENTRMAFINGCVTDKYIYMIYSGRYTKDENSDYGNSIYVYDWDGNPVKKLNLDRDIFTIGVSNNDESLFSYDLNTGYIINSEI